MNYQNNIKLINTLFVNNVRYTEDIASFLADSILDVGNNLFNCDTESKAKRLLLSLNKHIDKLRDLEVKKKVDLDSFRNSSLDIVKKMGASVDKQYRDYLIKSIKKIDSIANFYAFLIDEYKKYVQYKDCKAKTEKKHNIRYVEDAKGLLYANLYYNQGILVFDETSFKNEVWIFNELLNNDGDISSLFKDNNVSTLERKRRIYIKTMFNLYKGMKYVDKNKDMNIPVSIYYSFAIILVANLYKELYKYHRKNKEFNKLWVETVKSYGCSKGIDLYEKLYWDYVNGEQSIDTRKLDEVKKKISNRVFIDVEGDIPSAQDVYKVLYLLIIKNIDRNYGFYSIDFDERMETTMAYMSPQEMVDFYRKFKRVLLDHNCSNDELIKLQKTVVFMLNKRVPKNDKYICRNYLEEDKIF